MEGEDLRRILYKLIYDFVCRLSAEYRLLADWDYQEAMSSVTI